LPVRLGLGLHAEVEGSLLVVEKRSGKATAMDEIDDALGTTMGE
jgi:hypothetical protein